MPLKEFSDYLDLLVQAYGKQNLNKIYHVDKENLRLRYKNNGNDHLELNKFLLNYDRTQRGIDKGCKGAKIKKFNDKLCSEPQIFRNNFLNRPMELSGFEEWLDFRKKFCKEIMIIGEAAGPGILTHLNIAFGLGNFPIDKQGENNLRIIDKVFSDSKDYNFGRFKNFFIDEVKSKFKHNLWKTLLLFFSKFWDVKKTEIYITDVCKCNDDFSSSKNTDLWFPCMKKYLINEICLIRPKLIIFLGSTGYDYLKMYEKKEDCGLLKFTEEINPTKNEDIEQKYGKFSFSSDIILSNFYLSKKGEKFSQLAEHSKNELKKK